MLIEQYIFITIFFSVFIFFIYIHIAYPFWVHMPVSHTYDIHHRLLSNDTGIRVLQQHPHKNKWNDQKQVKTKSFYNLTDDDIKQFLDQLNCNYIPSDSILFTIEKKHFDALFSGHFDTPYISFFTPNVQQNLKGCIASYPVHVLYRSVSEVPSNFICYLGTDREKNSEITRKLISTHEYNCRNRVTDVKTSIIKKHIGKCSGVKPLLEFSTYVFYVAPKKPNNSKNRLKPVQIYRENWSVISEILELLPKLFDLSIYIDVGAMKARIDAGQLWIYCLKSRGEILAAYFIEDSMMLYENVNDYGGKTLSLAASINNMKKGNMEFAQGFADCLELIQKQNRDYTMLLIDDVGHNRHLTKQMRGEIAKTEGAYYNINSVFQDVADRGKVFIIV